MTTVTCVLASTATLYPLSAVSTSTSSPVLVLSFVSTVAVIYGTVVVILSAIVCIEVTSSSANSTIDSLITICCPAVVVKPPTVPVSCASTSAVPSGSTLYASAVSPSVVFAVPE